MTEKQRNERKTEIKTKDEITKKNYETQRERKKLRMKHEEAK